jgi:hypothetical protein
MAHILPCGRISADVTTCGVTRTVLVDTGAEGSAIADAGLILPSPTPGAYRITSYVVAGHTITTYKLRGITADITSQAHGTTVTASRSGASDVRFHSEPLGAAPFLTSGGFSGLMGMDLLDDFEVDPVKDRSGGSGYLADRA